LTLGLKVDDSLESYRRKITPAAAVSLIVRTILERNDSFDNIPEDILKDLKKRLEYEE
jgi:hypothetical protein